STTFNIPATAVCAGVSGAILDASVYFTQFNGWVLAVGWRNVYPSATSCFQCPGMCSEIQSDCAVHQFQPGNYINCLSTVPNFGVVGPCAGEPSGGSPMALSCTSRPFSTTQVRAALLFHSGCPPDCSTFWYILGGGDCTKLQP